MSPSPNVNVMEQVVFNLFRHTSTEQYKRFVIRIVHETITENNGITLNQLKVKLKASLLFNGDDVEAAVAALSNQKLFGSVSKFEVPVRKLHGTHRSSSKPAHLRPKQGTEFWNAWTLKQNEEHPEHVVSGLLLAR